MRVGGGRDGGTEPEPLPDAWTLITEADANRFLAGGFVRRAATLCSYDKGDYAGRASGTYRLFAYTFNGSDTYPIKAPFPSDWSVVSGLGVSAHEHIGTGTGTGTNYVSTIFVEMMGQNAVQVSVFGNDNRATAADVEGIARLALSHIGG